MRQQIVLGHDGLSFPAEAVGPAEGHPVLLLHGFPQTPACWHAVAAALAGRGLRAIAPTQRGYAATARPRGTGAYRLDELVGDVLAMADGLGADRFSLVGHDWGGAVAWAVAARRPDRVERLAVLSMPHPAAFVQSLRRSAQALRSVYAGFFRFPLLPERLLTLRNGAVLRAALRRSGLPARDADRYAEALATPEALGAALAWYRAASPRDLAAVPHVSVPTLFVWSNGDPALGRTAATGTADHVTGPYRFEILEGASHWLPETEGERVNALLVDHFAHSAAHAW